jgi:hypothetical protein
VTYPCRWIRKRSESYWEGNKVIIRIESSYYERSEIVKLGNEVIVFRMIVFLGFMQG